MYHIFTNKLWDIFSPRWAQGRCLRTRFSLSKYFLTSFIYSSNELRPPFERSWVINRGFFETIIPSVFTNSIVMWKSFLLADFDLFVAWKKKKSKSKFIRVCKVHIFWEGQKYSKKNPINCSNFHKCDSDVKVPLPGWFWFVCSLQCKCGLLVGSL